MLTGPLIIMKTDQYLQQYHNWIPFHWLFLNNFITSITFYCKFFTSNIRCDSQTDVLCKHRYWKKNTVFWIYSRYYLLTLLHHFGSTQLRFGENIVACVLICSYQRLRRRHSGVKKSAGIFRKNTWPKLMRLPPDFIG